MTKYTILGPIYPPEKCYLYEVLLWRAFGRFPEMQYSVDKEDYRFESAARDGYGAPIPGGSELSEGECSYAEIPLDPTTQAFLERKTTLDVSHYDELISYFLDTDQDQTILTVLREAREDAIALKQAMAEWTLIFDDYVDQFRAEIFQKLRNGTLRAFGTKLPNINYEKSLTLFENYNDLERAPATEIPPETWISKGIKWSDSALEGREKHFIWVHVLTEDLLSLFPPTQPIKPGSAMPVGENFVISTSKLARYTSAPSKRGRPALPWEQFHVEVARRFRDGEMPPMKETAIYELQIWFQKSFHVPVGRSTIGQRLKPYYDTLLPKDRK
jgi:hypothetical protein